MRAQRAAPPGLAAEDATRRKVFQSALAQSEELWDAAEAAGPASRPLPLFYCVSQAGRAVCAAWTQAEAWQPKGHGLKRRESTAGTPDARAFDYAATVDARPLGAYAMVADATASPTFAGRATVADLWASLPTWPAPKSVFGDRPRCLALTPVESAGDVRPWIERYAAPTHAVVHLPDQDLDAIVAAYPTMAGIEQDGLQVTTGPYGGSQPIYRFLGDDGRPRFLWDVGERDPGASVLRGDFIVRPRVGEAASELPSVFLTLWALLFCLSELARYYPDTWVGALDPDRSPAAVTLEHGLDLALSQTPVLIDRALHGPIAKLMREEVWRREAEASAPAGDAPHPDDE